VLIWVWLFISVAWFAINAFLIERHDFNFWFVAGLPFWIGLFFLLGARLTLRSWRKPPDHTRY
jgi:hypothetical protein